MRWGINAAVIIKFTTSRTDIWPSFPGLMWKEWLKERVLGVAARAHPGAAL